MVIIGIVGIYTHSCVLKLERPECIRKRHGFPMCKEAFQAQSQARALIFFSHHKHVNYDEVN